LRRWHRSAPGSHAMRAAKALPARPPAPQTRRFGAADRPPRDTRWPPCMSTIPALQWLPTRATGAVQVLGAPRASMPRYARCPPPAPSQRASGCSGRPCHPVWGYHSSVSRDRCKARRSGRGTRASSPRLKARFGAFFVAEDRAVELSTRRCRRGGSPNRLP
jgi:hypothetical protein